MIKKLLEEDRVDIFFQPIITIKDKKIFAYEALTRAYDKDETPISPVTLFEQARKENLSFALDNHVREKAVKKFKKIYEENSYSLLFLNIESLFIDEVRKDNLLEITKKYGVPAQNIVIEIKEDAVRDNNYLESFVSFYKKQGFILAIDDFGTGYSGFDRLSIIRPDIVKVDRSLIYNIHNNYINLQILNAISTMCHNIGALVLAEGVEEKEEITTCMNEHIDIFQGYWFSKPKSRITADNRNEIIENIEQIGNEFKLKVQRKHKKRKEIIKKIKALLKDKLENLNLHMKNLNDELGSLLFSHKGIEAIYLIDHDSGIQKGETYINTPKRSFYLPTRDGHDHSLKDYFYITKESTKGDYLGEKYISKASGNSCRTYSLKINIDEKDFIICFDLVGKHILY